MAATTQSTLTDLYQTYFSKELLQHAVQALVLDRYGLQAELPKNKGALTIRWFQPEVAAASNVQSLVEGTAISTFRNVTYSYVEATLAQYGEAAKISDVVTMTGLFDALKQSIQTMGEDCALHADTIVRNVLSHPSTGLTKRYAQARVSFASVRDATAANGKIIGSDILDAVTALKIARAKPLDGGAYVAILPPPVLRDLLRDTDVLDPAKYVKPEGIYKGEVGMLWGARIVEQTNPFQEIDLEGTHFATFSAGTNTTGFIYSCYVLGRGAYGTPKLAGTQSPTKPSIIINDKPDKSDPLGQFMTAGWKSYWAAKTLNSAYGVTLRCKSAYA